MKVVIEFVDQRKPDKESTWGFYVSEALKWLTRFLSAVKSYHHQVSDNLAPILLLMLKFGACFNRRSYTFPFYHSTLQLQSLVRREMQRHVVTAPLANPELIFVMVCPSSYSTHS